MDNRLELVNEQAGREIGMAARSSGEPKRQTVLTCYWYRKH